MSEHSSNIALERKDEDALIGPLIIRLALEQGITLLDLQKGANLSEEYVGGMRDGNRMISTWAIARCARVLDLPHAPPSGIQEPELSIVVAQIRQHLLNLAGSI
jgi:hypothetical protein